MESGYLGEIKPKAKASTSVEITDFLIRFIGDHRVSWSIDPWRKYTILPTADLKNQAIAKYFQELKDLSLITIKQAASPQGVLAPLSCRSGGLGESYTSL